MPNIEVGQEVSPLGEKKPKRIEKKKRLGLKVWEAESFYLLEELLLYKLGSTVLLGRTQALVLSAVICTLAHDSPAARTPLLPQVLLLPPVPPAAKWHQTTPGYAQTPISATRMRQKCQRHCAHVGQEVFLCIALYFCWGVKQKSAHACSASCC